MSWILGFVGAPCEQSLHERLTRLHEKPLHVSTGARHYVAAGGLPETCTFYADDEAGWAVVGLGILRREADCSFLESDDWLERLHTEKPRFDDLDGHFAAVRWRGDGFDAFTDMLGLRTLYLAAFAGGTVFSTRLDWLAKLTNNHEINFSVFGSHWLAFNQLSSGCLVEGIQRLGPGGRAQCRADHIEISEQPWLPNNEVGDPFESTLRAFLHPATPAQKLSLGLSGGLDSRLLLSLRTRGQDFGVHTFGHPDHPDAQIAGRIAAQRGLAHRPFHEPVPDADTCLHLLRDQVAKTQAVSVASSVLGLRYYTALRDTGAMMIDGGVGEAARRQFLNRLLRRGRSALQRGDVQAMLPHISYPRADVFIGEASAIMQQGTLDDIQQLWATLPDPQVLGEESFLDLLGIRTRIPNFFGYEQNRLDGVIQNYMPFAQPSTLNAVFRTPLAERKNGRLFRRLIRTHAPPLARYPLVKGNITYPFRLPTLPAFAWTKAKSALGYGFTNPDQAIFLDTLRPFIMDTLYSQRTSSYPAYDLEKLTRLVEGYYQGNHASATALDWWLAFEVWRQTVLDF